MKIKNFFENKVINQFIKFGIVGFINTLISYLMTNFGYYILHFNEQICNIITFCITVYISFRLNSKFVFKKEETKKEFWKSLSKVYISYSFTGLFLSAILLYIEERVYGIPHYIASFMNLIITVPLNFILNKFWAYRDRRENNDKII